LNLSALLPNVDLSGEEEGNVQLPDINISLSDLLPNLHFSKGKGKNKDFELPKFNITGPSIKLPSFNFSKGKGKDKDFELPKVNLSAILPSFNFSKEKGKDKDFELPKFNVTGPSIKLPSFNFSGKGKDKEFELPNVNLSAYYLHSTFQKEKEKIKILNYQKLI